MEAKGKSLLIVQFENSRTIGYLFFANQNEKRMGAPILRAIKEVGMYKAYKELYNKKKK